MVLLPANLPFEGFEFSNLQQSVQERKVHLFGNVGHLLQEHVAYLGRNAPLHLTPLFNVLAQVVIRRVHYADNQNVTFTQGFHVRLRRRWSPALIDCLSYGGLQYRINHRV